MTSIQFSAVHRDPPAGFRRVTAVVAVTLAVVLIAWAIVASLGARADDAGRSTTPRWSPVPTSQEIAAHQR